MTPLALLNTDRFTYFRDKYEFDSLSAYQYAVCVCVHERAYSMLMLRHSISRYEFLQWIC